MSEHEARLVRMANQMASFFRAYPAEEARAGIADHIAAYWNRVMRAELTGIIARGGAGLDPLVVEAFAGGATGESPVARGTAGPAEVGALGSDAG